MIFERHIPELVEIDQADLRLIRKKAGKMVPRHFYISRYLCDLIILVIGSYLIIKVWNPNIGLPVTLAGVLFAVILSSSSRSIFKVLFINPVIEKIIKTPNQGVDPTLKTPVDSVNA